MIILMFKEREKAFKIENFNIQLRNLVIPFNCILVCQGKIVRNKVYTKEKNIKNLKI